MSQPAPIGDGTAGQLARIWQELLGVDSIAPDQNYFDLGGDSSVAVHLFAQIEREFKVKLPLATLFEAPTIEELSRVLRRQAPSSGWSPLVAIQPEGSRPPLFCMHGAGGNILVYRDLARRLGSNQPFYGLQAPGLDGSRPPLTSIEDMAALYVKEIRNLQPHGPYFLGGYCMGGTVALEVAQQIRAQGERVALLALFDTMDWSKVPIPSVLGKSYQYVQRLGFHAANIFRLDGRGKVRFFQEKVKSLRGRVPVWRGMLRTKFGGHTREGASESLVLAKVWQANDLACVNYRPQPYTGRIVDFRPLKQYRAFDRPDAKWDTLAKGGLEVIVLPAYPAGMLVEPFVKYLAVALGKSIDDAIRSDGAS
jgi:thioesterase domain-containing protein/acyl carrier protein